MCWPQSFDSAETKWAKFQTRAIAISDDSLPGANQAPLDDSQMDPALAPNEQASPVADAHPGTGDEPEVEAAEEAPSQVLWLANVIG